MAAADRPNIHQTNLVSIVIPTLNEERRVASCLRSLQDQDPPVEILVVDGGSTDATVEIARQMGIEVLSSAPGLARQLNAGAAAAAGGALLFVHADTRLPHSAVRKVRRAIDGGVGGGGFTMRFNCPHASYYIAAVLADIYCGLTKNLFGDRALFATRQAFLDVGGFREIDLMSDLDFVVRLRRRGHAVRLIRGPVVSSARRFENTSIWRGLWWAWRLCRAFHSGRPLDKIAARFYSSPRR